ncbi:MAG: NAD(P)/FAD-dependent oxidoreductase [Candidatus Omnitrophica bacterium]|nr:NAD(P)/FAD-dependent oxidoreductase [Candidatus Omnitrophota bacterium]
MNKQKIVVIGGGPAGMMAAISAAEKHIDVVLLEKNRSLGRKLLLSGNGRCNFTNASNLNTFLTKYSKNGAFLRDAFKLFFNTDLINFFEKRGLKCIIDPEKKVFPANDKALSVLNVLKSELIKQKVSIACDLTAQDILLKNGIIHSIKLKNGNLIPCEKIILATGGASYPATGSTGWGIKIAQKFGHTIIPLKPGLVPLIIKEPYSEFLMGLSLKSVALKIYRKNRSIFTQKGDIIFTSNGISGPLALSLSNTIVDLLGKEKPVKISIDLFPDASEKELNFLLSEHIPANPGKSVKNSFKKFLPERLIDFLLTISQVNKEKSCAKLTRKEISSFAFLFKNFSLHVSRTASIKEAMVTRGGVSLKEIDPRTMASRIIPGLYFAGEIIDIAGDTGGYNLQSAFSTGYLAGQK